MMLIRGQQEGKQQQDAVLKSKGSGIRHCLEDHQTLFPSKVQESIRQGVTCSVHLVSQIIQQLKVVTTLQTSP